MNAKKLRALSNGKFPYFSAIGVNAAELIAEKDPFSAIALTRSLVTTLFTSSYW